MKKSKRLLAVLLSIVMAFSMFGATLNAFAASDKTYTPTYTEEFPVSSVNTLLSDVRTLLDNSVWAGLVDPILANDRLIKTAYGIYPALASLFEQMGVFTNKAAFYTDTFGDLFAGLQDPVSAQSLAEYLDSQDLGVTTSKEMFAKLAPVLAPLVQYPLFSNIITSLFAIVNSLCVSFGWDAEDEFGQITFSAEVFDPTYNMVMPGQESVFAEQLCTQLNAFFDYLREDTVGKIALGIRSLSNPENRTAFSQAYMMIYTVLSLLSNPMIGAITLPADISKMLRDILVNVAVNAQSEPIAFDFTKALNLIGAAKIIPDPNDSENNQSLGMTFAEINWDNLTNLDGENQDADTLMVLFHYLFQNLIENKTNAAAVGKLLGALVPGAESYLPLLTSFSSPEEMMAVLIPIVHSIANPAVTLTDPVTGVSVYAEAGVLLAGTQLTGKLIDSGDAYEKAMALATEQGAIQAMCFDLSLNLEGNRVQPDGTVTVSLPLPASYSAPLAVYAVGEDGSLTPIAIQADADQITFDVNYLGMFILAQNEEEPIPPTPSGDAEQPGDSNPTDQQIPDTGDSFLGAAVAMGLLSGAAIFLLRKRSHE